MTARELPPTLAQLVARLIEARARATNPAQLARLDRMLSAALAS